MKIWYSFEFDKFVETPCGECINAETTEPFDETVDLDEDREYIACHEVDVEDGSTIYVHNNIPYDAPIINSDESYFNGTINGWKQCITDYDVNHKWEDYYSEESGYFMFNSYIVEFIKHNLDNGYILVSHWKKFDYKEQFEKITPMREELLSYFYSPDRMEFNSLKLGMDSRTYLLAH